mmetsp:Transcript_10049/g.29948  ORF Transcript_10049/g.29948 Transcript_10049/m.29948 type:complete len:355 (-) Transcript_10049:1576-2640(-)
MCKPRRHPSLSLLLRPAGYCRTARGSPVRRGATSTRAPRPAGSSELESGDRVEVWEGLAAEAAAVLAEGPEGENVAVVCVRDHAVVVEDAGDELLRPVARRLLHRHQEGSRAREDRRRAGHRLVAAFRAGEEGEHRPRRVDDLRRVCMVVLLPRGRQVGLAPAAVGQLLGAQKRERLGDVRRGCLPLADRGEADHAKPRAIGEADAPRAVPRAVGPLLVADPLRAELDRRRDLGGAVAGMAAVEVREGGDAGAGQLAVRVVDDDVPEALGRVEQLERRGASRVLVGGPAAGAPVLGGVLVRENDVDAIEQPLRLERRYAGQAEGLDSDDALEPFRRAVRDRPAVVLGREGPRAV